MRTFDHEIRLIGIHKSIDDEGFEIIEDGPGPAILANRISIRSSEFWSAKQENIKLVYTFEVHSIEYEGEERLLYKEAEDADWLEYKIERSYEKDDGLTELVCSR